MKIRKQGESIVSGMSNPMSSAGPTIAPPVAVQQQSPLALPEGFGQVDLPIISTGSVDHYYIKFWHPMAPDANDVRDNIRGLQEGNPVLFTPEGNHYLLNPFKFLFLHAKQYWGLADSVGEDQEISLTPKRGEENGMRWGERIHAALLVWLEGKDIDPQWIPALITAKGPKTPAFQRAAQQRVLASRPEWGDNSSEHKFAQQVNEVHFRYTTLCTFTNKTARAKQGKPGMDYIICDGACYPIKAGELKALSEFYDDGESGDQLDKMWEAYKRRNEEFN